MKKSYKLLFSLGLLFSHYASSGQIIDSVLYDMVGPIYRTGPFSAPWGKHEAPLNGVPSNYDWADGARPGVWLDGVQSGNYGGITVWGQVYVQAGGSPETNYRVQIRNLKLYAFVNNQWDLLIQTDNQVQGGNFLEDFNPTSTTSNVRSETSNGGGVSVTMVPGKNYHWWDNYWPRASMPTTATALYASAEVRLIPDTNPNVDLSQVRVLAATGLDAYDTPTAVGQFIPSIGIPRHKFVKSDWQFFTFYVVGDPIPTSLIEFQNLVLSKPLPPGVRPTASNCSTCVQAQVQKQ